MPTATVSDQDEALCCDANNPDSDGDGLTDGDEVHIWNTSAGFADSDNEGLSDYDEVIRYRTNPNLPDSDGDRINDLHEIQFGINPNDPDSDNDGDSDYLERENDLDPNDPDDNCSTKPGGCYGFPLPSTTTSPLPPPPNPPVAPPSVGLTGRPSTAATLQQPKRPSTDLTLAWTHPVSGLPSNGYRLAYAPAGGAWGSTNLGVRTSWTLTGLKNGTKYYVYLYAMNSAGNSPAAKATATFPNGTPRNYRVTAVGNGRVSLAWTAPASGTSTSGYHLSYAVAGGTWRSISLGSRTSYTLTGLRNGTKYYVYLVAVSSGGRSPAATASATTLGTLPPPPPPPPVTFGAGTYRVGIDIPSGLYRASGSSDPTTW